MVWACLNTEPLTYQAKQLVCCVFRGRYSVWLNHKYDMFRIRVLWASFCWHHYLSRSVAFSKPVDLKVKWREPTFVALPLLQLGFHCGPQLARATCIEFKLVSGVRQSDKFLWCCFDIRWWRCVSTLEHVQFLLKHIENRSKSKMRVLVRLFVWFHDSVSTLCLTAAGPRHK